MWEADVHDGRVRGVHLLDLEGAGACLREGVVVLGPLVSVQPAYHRPAPQQPLRTCPIWPHLTDAALVYPVCVWGGVGKDGGHYISLVVLEC